MTSEARRVFVVLYRPVRPGFKPENATAHESAAIAAHFQFLKRLHDGGDLVLAGPRLDAAFGVGIFFADSPPSAESLIASDPVVTAGVFSAEVAEMRLSLPPRGMPGA